MSMGELTSVLQSIGGFDVLADSNAKDKDAMALFKYIADENKLERLLENQQLIKTLVVRSGKQATVGYQPDVWKGWN